MSKTDQIQKHLKFSTYYMPGVVAYEIIDNANGDSWQHIQVIFNNNPSPIIFPVEKKNWVEIANGLAIDEGGLSTHFSETAFVPPVSMLLWVSQ